LIFYNDLYQYYIGMLFVCCIVLVHVQSTPYSKDEEILSITICKEQTYFCSGRIVLSISYREERMTSTLFYHMTIANTMVFFTQQTCQ